MMIDTFPALLQSFFTDRLIQQWRASEHTVASYRDAFRLLLRFASEKLGKEPSVLSLKDLTPDFLSSFLEYVEKGRNNCVRTRNSRLAAIHSFFRYVSFKEPEYAKLCYQILREELHCRPMQETQRIYKLMLHNRVTPSDWNEIVGTSISLYSDLSSSDDPLCNRIQRELHRLQGMIEDTQTTSRIIERLITEALDK